MSEIVRVVVDAMGGDNAPGEIVKGAVAAANKHEDIHLILTGLKDAVENELKKYTYPADRIEVVPTTQVIETAEPPVAAIRTKKDSSIVVGLTMVRHGQADAFVSAGSTGAVLVGGQAIVGRIKGIERPALAPLIPTADGVALLIDCGANVDARSSHLVQFAKMGSIYMEHVVGVKRPRVGIVNIGAAREIPAGACDVVVCEAFVGNVILKLYEGVGSVMIRKIKGGLMTDLRTKLGALLIKPALKKTLKSFDASEYGGAPLLGLKGLVVKTHGSAKAIEVEHSIDQCVQFKQQHISEKIEKAIHKNDEM